MNNVFCLRNLQENALVPNYENILVYSEVDRSFYSECYKAIGQVNHEYRQATMSYHKAVLESGGNLDVVHESFSDFLTRVKEIVKKFIDFIKSIFARFITAINKIILSDKYLKKHKEDLMAFDKRDEFEYEGYNFTIADNIPVINAQVDFNQDFMGINFDVSQGEKFIEVITKAYDKFMNEVDNGKYDHYRAQVIQQHDYISHEDFPNELFECFRDGMHTAAKINVTSAKVTECMTRFTNYEHTKKNNEKIKNDLEKQYKEIEKKISHLVTSTRAKDANKALTVNVDSQYSSATKQIKITNEAWTKFDLYIKAKIDEVVQLSNIHSLAFSYKLDAIKDCYTQDKRILYKALAKVQKNHKGELK